jgi:TPR repeat protein
MSPSSPPSGAGAASSSSSSSPFSSASSSSSSSAAAASDDELDAAESAYFLGAAYEAGAGGLPRDYALARRHFEAAAGTGLVPEAHEALGFFDSYGYGLKAGEPDVLAAKANFLLAQTPTAYLMLADMYQQGHFDDTELREIAEDEVAAAAAAAAATAAAATAATQSRQLSDEGEQTGKDEEEEEEQTKEDEEEEVNILVVELANNEAWRYYTMADDMGYLPATAALGVMALHGAIPESVLGGIKGDEYSKTTRPKKRRPVRRSPNKKDGRSPMPDHLDEEGQEDAERSDDEDWGAEDGIAWSYFQRGLDLLADQAGAYGDKANVTVYDANHMDLYYYAGYMRLNGWGPEPASCEAAAEFLSQAARHTLWLQDGGPASVSLYNLLQTALVSYERQKEAASSLSSSSASPAPSTSPYSPSSALETNEALRRYEVLAFLGDPQSQLNAGFLFAQLARDEAKADSARYWWADFEELRTTLAAFPFGRQAGSAAPLCLRPSPDRVRWLERARKYYALAAAQGVAEAQREVGHCLWGAPPWGASTCAASGEFLQVHAEARIREAKALLEAAAAGGAGDIQAVRALAALNGAGAAGHPHDRPESRRLYRLCANMGGYPDGLPCTFELLAMEVAWFLGYV